MKRLIPKRFPRVRAFVDRNSGLIAFSLVVALGATGLWQVRVQTERNQHAISQATRALCSVRRTYEVQVKRSYEFLKEHPHGIPGITATVIYKSIMDNKARIQALSDVDCINVP